MFAAIRYLFQNAKGLIFRFLIFLVLFTCNMIVAFKTPFAIKDFTEELLKLHDVNQIRTKGLIVAIYILAFYVVKWLIMYLKVETSTLLALEIRKNVYDQIVQNVDVTYYRSKGASYFTQVIGYDVNMVGMLFEQGMTIIVEIISAILTCVALVQINVSLTIVVLIFSPVYWFVLKKMYNKAGENMQYFFQQRVASSKTTNDFVFGMLDLKVNNGLQWMVEKYVKVQKRYLSFIMKMAMYMTFSTSSTEFILTCMQVLVILVGIQFVNTGYLEIPMLLAFLTMMNRLYQPLITWCANSLNMQQGITGYKRIKEVLVPVKKNSKHSIDVNELKLVLTNISYGYENGEKVLNRVNLHLQHGEWVVIYGPSGSGKSTLLEIVAGIIKPQSGTILLNDTELFNIHCDSLHKLVAVVTEEMYLIEGSIFENVAYTRPVNESEISALLKEVQLDDLLNDPTLMIKRDGSNLSVGQKQRLAIVRALYQNPRILLMDEPTSALDYETELAVIEALKRRNGIAVLMVTHRTNLMKYADRVFTVQSGELVEKMVG